MTNDNSVSTLEIILYILIGLAVFAGLVMLITGLIPAVIP